MVESKDLKIIKKLYGEKFMHLCKELFPTILDFEGVLIEIITSSFANNSRLLYESIVNNGLKNEFKDYIDYIFSKLGKQQEKIETIEKRTPYELLDEAGYDLYECNSEEDIQSFKKYYKSDEELCTFKGGRLEKCVVFWAVRKNVDEIKREDFTDIKRDDEYGTSVMSIQFSKTESSTVSIKNRYNHKVENPDATYGNNLDRIIPGLSQSFANLLAKRGIEFSSSNVGNFELPGYVIANDGKYYEYNMEINDIYYCSGNIIIQNGEVIKLASEKQVLIDYFILDKENKTLSVYDDSIQDAFQDFFLSSKIEKIEMEIDNEEENGARKITIHIKNCKKPVVIKIDIENNIIVYINENLEKIGDEFLSENKVLRRLIIPNVLKIGDNCLYYTKKLQNLELPSVMEIGDGFLFYNYSLTRFKAHNLVIVGDSFMCYNDLITPNDFDTPNLIDVGDDFFYYNERIKQIYLNIDSKKIAKLDKKSKLTTTEIEQGRTTIENIREIEQDER